MKRNNGAKVFKELFRKKKMLPEASKIRAVLVRACFFFVKLTYKLS
jgi:hypothetical protein